MVALGSGYGVSRDQVRWTDVIGKPEIAARHVGLVHIAEFGGSPSASGAQNRIALETAYAALLEEGGGILSFGAGRYLFEPCVLPHATRAVELVGVNRGTRFAMAAEGVVADGEPRRWLMEFGDDSDGTVSSLVFQNIWLEPPSPEGRRRFHGIWVHSTNELRVVDCHARLVDGTAWRFDRAHNSKIEARTYRCGSSIDAHPSLLMTGTLASFAGNADAVWNDAVMTGASERDHLGWRIENGLMLRRESSLKIHGGPESSRSLHLHNIASGALSVLASQDFYSEEMILISDGLSAQSSLVDVTTAAVPTQLSLTLQNNFNCRAMGTGLQALAAIDCAASSSSVEIGGMLMPLQAPNGARSVLVRLRAPGHDGAHVDLSGIRTRAEEGAFVLDERLSSQAGTYALPRPGSPGSGRDIRLVTLTAVAGDQALAVRDGVAAFAVPRSVEGRLVRAMTVSVQEPGSGGATKLQMRRRRDGLDQVLTGYWSFGENYSAELTGFYLSDRFRLQAGDVVCLDIKAVHTTPPRGLSATLELE